MAMENRHAMKDMDSILRVLVNSAHPSEVPDKV